MTKALCAGHPPRLPPGPGCGGEARGGTASWDHGQGLNRIPKHFEDEALSGLLRRKSTGCKEKLLLNDGHGIDDFAIPICSWN